jgi:hypothetical protein
MTLKKIYTIERGSNNNFKVVCSALTEDQVFQVVKEILEKEKYEVYYYRQWNYDDGYSYIDYGSHSNFFRYKLIDEATEIKR